MSKSLSILIGAGFSAPIGYPVGAQLNELLVNCTGNEFAFHTDGTMIISANGKKPDIGYKTNYDQEFEFCKKLISFYKTSKGYFDYEEFYDFINGDAAADASVVKLAKPYLEYYSSVKDLLHSIDNIYVQLIDFYLKDKDGNKWYDNSGHACRPIFPGYTGILNCLKELMTNYVINVHSLNHDLFFERLNWSDWISGELCDGFEETGSPYYGKLYSQGREYMVRLERYTGRYLKKMRLYKLHGSRDYGLYYTMQNNGIANPEMYVKTRYGVRIGDIFKEKEMANGELEYEHCFINYHADFLTGTTSKIHRYNEPLIYEKLFEIFRNNLRDAEKLIIIGYGAKDPEINKIIRENFSNNKSAFIIDPYAGKQVLSLQEMINAKLITEKHLENLLIEDLK